MRLSLLFSGVDFHFWEHLLRYNIAYITYLYSEYYDQISMQIKGGTTSQMEIEHDLYYKHSFEK